jgi:hypothetical protein
MDTNVKFPYYLEPREKGVFLCKKEKESAKLRKYDAWTVHYPYVILCKFIEYKTEKGTYTISAAQALDVGFPQTYNEETKLIIPLMYWDFE